MFVKVYPPIPDAFVYKDEAPRYFYMKNTFIPLDIIWRTRIRSCFYKENAEAENLGFMRRSSPRKTAMYVLELNSASADKIGLRIRR